MTLPLRIGTRGSPLALAQARMAGDALEALGYASEIVPITTTGDIVQDRPLAEIGGKALWTKELDRALLDGRTDLSVHSMKDVETIRPEALDIPAMLPRESTADHLIGADSIAVLPTGAVVGTSSPRRKAQLLALRPDLRIVSIRGNVQTRLEKVGREVDATILAAAGLSRLGIKAGTPLDDFLPAPSQGAIGVEIVADRADLRETLRRINHKPTWDCVGTERAFLEALGGDCHSAVAALARYNGDWIELEAEILSPDGREVHRAKMDPYASPEALALDLLGRASPGLRAMFVG